MLLLLLSATVLLGGVQALTQENANLYMENVLGNQFSAETYYARLDPYKLEDIKITLNDSKKSERSATFSKGQLLRLSTVRRSADCTVPLRQSSNVTFTCFLTFDQLRINYTTNASTDDTEVLFYSLVSIRGTNVTIQVTSNPQDDIPNLRLLFISKIGKINVSAQIISSLDSAKFITSQIHSVLVTHTIQNLHRVINGRFKEALAYSIYKTPVFMFPED